VAVWQWEVAYHDIGFRASLRRNQHISNILGEAEETDVCPWARHPASSGLVEGNAVLPLPSLDGGREGGAGASQLVLTWDNRCENDHDSSTTRTCYAHTHTHTHAQSHRQYRYSLRRAKEVSLRIGVVPLDAYEAARLSAQEAMAAAIWVALAREGVRVSVCVCVLLCVSVSVCVCAGAGKGKRVGHTQRRKPTGLTTHIYIHTKPCQTTQGGSDEDSGFSTPCSSPRKQPSTLLPAATSFASPRPSPSSAHTPGHNDDDRKARAEEEEAFTLSFSSPTSRSAAAATTAPLRPRPRSESTASVDSTISLRDRDRGFWTYLQNALLGAAGVGGGGQEPQPPSLSAAQRSSSSSLSSSAGGGGDERERPKPTACHMCGEGFGLFRRAHRCRRCGGAFCLPCSRHFVILPGAAEVLGCVFARSGWTCVYV
jgi:hypothetical protein